MNATPSHPRAVIAIHGGAGAIARASLSAEAESQYLRALADILAAGQAILADGGSALDAVTEAVRLLEDCALFNAGHGAVLTSRGTHELDAAVMDGATLRSGAVAGLRCVKNPVLAARAVMASGKHVFFIGEGAEQFACDAGLDIVDPSYFVTPARLAQLARVQRDTPDAAVLDHDGQARLQSVPPPSPPTPLPPAGEGGVTTELPSPAGGRGVGGEGPLDDDKKLGTVGAVALDAHGNLAAATSTGGITNKQPGRVGDSPVIGAGTYASNATCAVSATGIGEAYIRLVAAYDVAAQMQYAGRSLIDAAASVIHQKLPAIGGHGGLIAVDAQGNVACPFNTEGMYRGVARVGEVPVCAIYRDSQGGERG